MTKLPLAFITAALLAANSPDAAKAAQTDTLRYGIDDPGNVNRLPQEIALREGLFAREGLNVEIVRFTSSFRNRGQAAAAGAAPATVREAMAQGAIDVSREQLPLLINEAMDGGKYKGVAVTVSDPLYFLAVRPEIKTFADLKGKTVTITNPRDGITVWTRELLSLHGLKTPGDVALKNIAGSDGRFDCLNGGECAGAALDQPAIFKALDAGHHVIGATNEDGPMLFQVDIADPAWAAAHRDAVVKYIRGTTAAMRFIRDPKNRAEVVKVMADYMKQPQERAATMLTYIVDPKNRTLPQQTGPDLNAIRQSIGLLGKYEILPQPLPPPERFIDASYGEAASH